MTRLGLPIIYQARPTDNGPGFVLRGPCRPPNGGSRTKTGEPISTSTMEPAAKKRLGDIIVERGLVTADQLEEALRVQREQGGKLGEVLVELGFITRVGLAGVITEQFDTMRLTSRARKAEHAAAAAAPVV